jgi:hypothetical protein
MKVVIFIAKALIWIVCFIPCSLCFTFLKERGIRLGAIPTMYMFGGMWTFATYLCKKVNKLKKQDENISPRENVEIKAYNIDNENSCPEEVPRKFQESYNEVTKAKPKKSHYITTRRR